MRALAPCGSPVTSRVRITTSTPHHQTKSPAIVVTDAAQVQLEGHTRCYAFTIAVVEAFDDAQVEARNKTTVYAVDCAKVRDIEVNPGELAHITGAVIVGEREGHVRVTGSVELSASFNGMFCVETEVGSLYLDEDLPVTIVNPDLHEERRCRRLAQAVGLLRAS